MIGFCFEIVTLDLDSQKINHLEFIISLIMFLDKEIFKKGYSIISFGVDGSIVDGLHIQCQFQIK